MSPIRIDVEKKVLGIFPKKEIVLVVLDNQIANTQNVDSAPRTYVSIICPRIVIITHLVDEPIKQETIQLTEYKPQARRDILRPAGRLDIPPKLTLTFTQLPAGVKTPKLSNDPLATLVKDMFTLRKRSPWDQ